MGFDKEFSAKALELGEALANRQVELVYGGGSIGMMGAVAHGCLSHGGRVTGVITEKLMALEVGHDEVSEMLVVKTMHERKAMMMDLADAFIILPGGFGTLEEFFEVLTWQQLEYHQKPICLYNMQGYFDDLIQFVIGMCKQGFLSAQHLELFRSANTLEGVFESLNEPVQASLMQWKATPEVASGVEPHL